MDPSLLSVLPPSHIFSLSLQSLSLFLLSRLQASLGSSDTIHALSSFAMSLHAAETTPERLPQQMDKVVTEAEFSRF